jgi:hypothetical protein
MSHERHGKFDFRDFQLKTNYKFYAQYHKFCLCPLEAGTGAWGMDFVSSSPLFSTTPLFSKFSYKSFLFQKPKNCGHRIHVLFMMYDVYWYCQMKKNEWLWKFWKRNDLYENFEKRVVVEKRGEEETKYMPHAPVEAGASLFCVHSPICNIYTTVFRFKQLNNCTRFTPRFNSKNRGINDL